MKKTKRMSAKKANNRDEREQHEAGLGFLSKYLLGKFDDPKVTEIFVDVLAIMGGYWATHLKGEARKVREAQMQEDATNRIFEQLTSAIRNGDVSFLENLIDCIKFASGRGDGSDPDFLKRCKLPDKSKSRVLVAYQEVRIKEGRLPTLSEIEMYVAHTVT